MLKVVSILIVCFWHAISAWCVNATITTTAVKCNGGNNGIISIKITENTSGCIIRLLDADNNKLVQSKSLLNDSTLYFSNCKAGKYLIQLISQSTSNDFEVQVEEPKKLTAEVIEMIAIYGKGESVTADLKLIYSGGTPPYSFQWLENANDQRTEIAKGLSLGIYTCNLNDSNNCGPVSATFFLFEDEIEKFNLTNNPQNEKL